jgi:hypothetical protein
MVSPHTLQVTLLTALPKMSCSLPHFGHFTRRKVLCGFGMSLFHSDKFCFASISANNQLSQSNANSVSHVTADFALQPQRLLLCGFGELALKRIFLSAVTLLFPFVMPFTFRHVTAFSRLVQTNRVNLMNLTLRTVSPDFLGNVHVESVPAFQ